jgi:polyhydroxybutyrate depolymerase
VAVAAELLARDEDQPVAVPAGVGRCVEGAVVGDGQEVEAVALVLGVEGQEAGVLQVLAVGDGQGHAGRAVAVGGVHVQVAAQPPRVAQAHSRVDRSRHVGRNVGLDLKPRRVGLSAQGRVGGRPSRRPATNQQGAQGQDEHQAWRAGSHGVPRRVSVGTRLSRIPRLLNHEVLGHQGVGARSPRNPGLALIPLDGIFRSKEAMLESVMALRTARLVSSVVLLSLAACQVGSAEGSDPRDTASEARDVSPTDVATVLDVAPESLAEVPPASDAPESSAADAPEAEAPAPDRTEPVEVLLEPAAEAPDVVEALPEVVETAADTAPDAISPPAPVGCVTSVEPGHHVFPCQGLDVDIEVPALCLGTPCGLILDLHGLTMNAQQQDNNTNLRALGQQFGYLVVQPSAKDPPPLSKWVTYEDDEKVWAFAADARNAWHTDPRRFHVTGFSQGGFMTWRLLCAHADVIASAAPAGSCAGYGIELPYVGSLSEVGCSFTGNQKPALEIPILQMHGTLDPIIPYFCGTNLKNAVIDAWNLAEGATVSEDDDHWWKRYQSPSGNTYEFISHNYRSKSWLLQGHCIPGSQDLDGGEPGQLLGGFGCDHTSPFVWGEAVMAFFLAHPKPDTWLP